MSRLSVSLDPEQADWIAERAQEIGVSKGKVIRECIEDVRTGNSLFTTPVQSDESGDEDRIGELEARLASLEEAIRNSTGSGAVTEHDPVDEEPVSEPSTTAGESSVTTSAGDQSDSVEHSRTTEQTEQEQGSNESYSLPGSVVGDVGDESATAQSEPTDTDVSSEASGNSPTQRETPTPDDDESSPASTESRKPPAEKSQEPADDPGSADERPPTTSDEVTNHEAPSTNTASGDSSDAEASAGPDGFSELPDDSERPDDSSQRAPQSNAPQDGDSEVETVDVDKSDPEAIRSYLETELGPGDHATAVFACWTRLRDRGTVHKRSMQAMYDDYPLQHENAREWWRESIKPELVRLPGVVSPKGGGKLYRFKY